MNDVDIDIEKHQNLIRYVMKRLKINPNGFFDKDDYYQAGLIGLWIAANKYDPSRGTKFSTHAVPWIRSQISKLIDYERAEKRVARTVSIYNIVSQKNDVPLMMLDIIPNEVGLEEKLFGSIELNDRISEAMKYEPFIVTCLLNGDRAPQIGKKMGISQQRVHQRLKAMRKKLMA
ncbi:sigma-70 family RNA polymerase sigma factor [Brevibacillus formosus]